MIDSEKPLSKSMLWELQHRYYEGQGIEAWRTNIVPSYITSNPYIGLSYAKLALGYLRDFQQQIDLSQPVYIVELGAGGGRFAFYFIQNFLSLLPQSPFPDLRFTYVLTDLPERNVQFWREHPDFEQWTEEGRLDFARFDALADEEIHLRGSSGVIRPGNLANPLIVLANYFFDSLPQDAFHVEQGLIQECRIRLTSKQEESDLTDESLLHRLMLHFLTQDGDQSGYYGDPDLDSILEQYRALENSYVLFSADGIRLIRKLARMAGERLLLICGDYGPCEVEDWDHNGSPDVRIHGSISMEVNFHALGQFVKNQGGQAFVPSAYSQYLTVCAYAFGDPGGPLMETGLAYQEAIDRASPNDFFLMKRGMENAYGALSVEETLAYLRFSGWDPHLFLDCFPALLEALPNARRRDQEELARGMHLLWQNYYHLGEERDLPFSIGVVLFRLGMPDEAQAYFEQSLIDYGPSELTFYNLALCLSQQGETEDAMRQIAEALKIDPQFEPALLLQKELAKPVKAHDKQE